MTLVPTGASYHWAAGDRTPRGSAQVFAEHVHALQQAAPGGVVTAEVVWEDARDARSPIHVNYPPDTWDQSVAARLHQLDVTRKLLAAVEDQDGHRAFLHVKIAVQPAVQPPPQHLNIRPTTAQPVRGSFNAAHARMVQGYMERSQVLGDPNATDSALWEFERFIRGAWRTYNDLKNQSRAMTPRQRARLARFAPVGRAIEDMIAAATAEEPAEE